MSKTNGIKVRIERHYEMDRNILDEVIGKRSVKGACRRSSRGAMIGAWQRQQRKCPLSA
jgi:hypothetical protein